MMTFAFVSLVSALAGAGAKHIFSKKGVNPAEEVESYVIQQFQSDKGVKMLCLTLRDMQGSETAFNLDPKVAHFLADQLTISAVKCAPVRTEGETA